MKSVIKSVSPEICEKISTGDCKILISKTAPKCEAPFRGYIYATKMKKRFVRGISTLCNKALYLCDHKLKVLEGWDITDANITDIFCRVDGKIIGEFICDKIERFSVGSLRSDDIVKLACLSYNEMIDYFYKPEELDGKTVKQGYAWHISDLKIYDEPKQISDFLKPCPDPYQYCTICKHCVKIIPPDEEEYALYHGGHYDYCEEYCRNILRKPPKG